MIMIVKIIVYFGSQFRTVFEIVQKFELNTQIIN